MQGEPLARAEHTVERSRFYALLYGPRSEAEVKALLAQRKRAVKKACHHCWASRVVDEGGRVHEQARDDGEVGRPGMKILEVLRRHQLEGVLVVSRVFGGVKLGPGNVGRAFAHVAEMAASSRRK